MKKAKMKLKPISNNTVVHTPTEEEAKELLAILHENGYSITYTLREIKEVNGYEDEDICFCIHDDYLSHSTKEWYQKKHNILALAEFKERYCEEKPQPKFKVGDRVKVVGYQTDCIATMGTHVGEVGTIIRASEEDGNYYHITCDNGCFSWHEDWLELYTEPETKPTEDMETKEETKELNLCELLKGHEGEKFYSLSLGEVTLKKIENNIVLCFINEGMDEPMYVRFDGTACYGIGGVCLIFPSRALYEQYPLDPYAAWMKWQEEQKKHWVSVTAWIDDIECESDTAIDTKKIYFRTSADRDKCLDEIKAVIEKYSSK